MANKPTKPKFPLGLESQDQSVFQEGILNNGVIEHGPDAVMTVPETPDASGVPSAVRYNEDEDQFEGYYNEGGWLPLGGGNGGRWELLPHASSSLLQIGRAYLVDNTDGASTVVFPSPKRVGDSITVCDLFGKFSTYPLTVDGNGKSIYGSADSMTISTDNVSATFTWTGETRGWVITSGVGLGQGRVYSREIYSQILSATTPSITLSTQPSIVDVYVDGKRLKESLYTLDGYEVKFDPVLASGSDVQVIQYIPIQLGAGGGGSGGTVITWEYNGGSAIGGETQIVLDVVVDSVSEIYIRGTRQQIGRGFTFDPATSTITLADELEAGDDVVVVINGDPTVYNQIDRTPWEVARANNVPNSEVILSTDKASVLDGKTVLYDVSSQTSWGIPDGVPHNSKILSVSNGTLIYFPGNISVSLTPLGEAELRKELISPTGSFLIGLPKTINDLKDIAPNSAVSVKTLGALNLGDGGGDTWVFDPSDMSNLVSLYPKIFIAPTADPTGASGAWKLAWNMKGINASAYGIGCQAENYAHDTAALQQLGDWNRAVQWINLPSEMYIIELNYAENPKFYGIAGANSDLSDTRGMGSREHGSVIYARDADSSNPVIHIHGNPGTDRLGGVDLCFISVVSVDLIENRDLTIKPELNKRSTRTGVFIEYVASKTNIQGLGVFGFKKCLYGNEVWDGSIRDLAISIGSDEDGTVPAVFFGSYGSDNTNNLTIDTFRIEHCPFSLEVGFVDHVRFVNGKIETYRKPDATHYVVKVDSNAERYLFSGMMFVTNPTTRTPFLYEQGRQGTYSSCWMTSGGITGSYPGVRWIYRDPTGTSVVKFMGMTINGPMQADGTDPTAYPIYLASYDEFGGVINCYDSFTVNGSVVNPSYQGLICMNTGTKMGKLHINTNNITKTAGTIFYARGGDYDIGKPTISGAPHSLLAGVKNDIRKMITSASDIEIYRRETILLSSGTTLNSMKGYEGQVIRVMTFGTGCTIKHSGSINNSSGADIAMTVNTVYTYMMLTGTTAKQI